MEQGRTLFLAPAALLVGGKPGRQPPQESTGSQEGKSGAKVSADINESQPHEKKRPWEDNAPWTLLPQFFAAFSAAFLNKTLKSPWFRHVMLPSRYFYRQDCLRAVMRASLSSESRKRKRQERNSSSANSAGFLSTTQAQTLDLYTHQPVYQRSTR